MNIVLASTNIAKTNALKSVMKQLELSGKLITIDADSGVSATPSNDDEGIKGCRNRIADALTKNKGGDLYVGMEGIITTSSYGTYICGWAAVHDVSLDRYAYGCSAKVQIPELIANKIQSFKELSTLVKETYPSDLLDKMDEIGTNGVVTNEQYTRVDEFVDALQCAFGYLSNDTNYQA